MKPLEMALILLCVLGAVLLVYLILVVKQLLESMKKMDGILEENTANINKIIENAEAISSDAENITNKISAGASSIDAITKKIPVASAAQVAASMKYAKKALDFSKISKSGKRIASFVLSGKLLKELRNRKK